MAQQAQGKKIRSILKKVTINPTNALSEFPRDKPGVIYVRQSKIQQKENNIHSFEMQTDKFEQWFREGLDCTNHIEIISDDEGLSGTLSIHERKGLTRVMRLINGEELLNGEYIGWIGAVHVNRLSRDKWLVTPGTIMQDCYKNNVWIATLRMLFNFQDTYCQRVFIIEAEESARHLEWMRLVMGGGLRTASSHGYYDGRWISPGYIVDRTDEKKKKYVIYEPHAERVRWLFKRYFELDGNFPLLCKEVEAMPYFFPAFESWVNAESQGKFPGNRKQKGTLIKEGPYAGNYWISKAGLKSVLCNPVYIGWWLPIDGGVIEDNHAAITEDALFVYAHKRLSSYDLKGQRQKPEHTFHGKMVKNILTPVIVDDRGERMYMTIEKKGVPFFRSVEINSLAPNKYRYGVNAKEFENFFLEKLFERIKVLEHLEWSDKASEQPNDKAKAREEAKKNIKKQIDHAKRQKAEMQDTLDDPDIPKTKQMKIDYATKIGGLEGQINQWQLELKKLDEEKDEDEEVILFEIQSLLPSIQKKWDKINIRTRYRFINALVRKVVVIDVASSWMQLEIHWKPSIGDFVDIAYIKKSYSNKKGWTPEEEAILRELYPTASQDEIMAALPGRGWSSIQGRAYVLKVKRIEKPAPGPTTCKPWSAEDIAKLREVYPEVERSVIMECFPDRTWVGVQLQARKLDLRRIRKEPRHTSAPFSTIAPSVTDRQFEEEKGIIFTTGKTIYWRWAR